MRINLFKICVSAAVLLFAAFFCGGQDIPRGTVIKKVACLENKEQSYALYLPLNYLPGKKWPALFIFDPDGDGSSPAEIFQAAAEKYGFIIIASNNTRNGLGPAIQSEFIKTLWKDSHARFAIDERRTYAAGFSGGARLANNFAYSCKGCIAGVISCGAGFPPEFPLDKELPYSLFDTTGFDDFNYPEMIKLDKTLSKLGVPHHTARFEAEHEWLNKELAFEAFEWFNLQAMKTGRLAKNDAFISEIRTKREAEADKLLQSGQILEAYDNYDSLARIFTGLANTSGVAEKMDRISKDKNYRDALKNEKELFDRQTTTVRAIILRAHDLLDPELKDETAHSIFTELSKIRETAKAKEDSDERRLARRILHAILAESNESGAFIYMQKKDYKSAAANFELASLVRPENPYIEISLARALILDGRKKEAIEALNRAVEKGLKECRVFSNDEAFAALKTDKDFLRIKTTLNCVG